MSIKRKKPRKLSEGTRQYLALIDQYSIETGNNCPDLHEVAAWAYRNGLAEPRRQDAVKQIAREMARAARQDYVVDDNGEPVRMRHAIKETRGDRQLTFWFKMSEATPEMMRLTAQGRRGGVLMDILQIDRDISYYNKNYNPGDDLQMDFDFNKDIEERHLPEEYPDGPGFE